MKAVITVTGKDSMGIISKVSALCTEYGANIVDISQTVMQEYFAMIMLVDLEQMKAPFGEFSDICLQSSLPIEPPPPVTRTTLSLT